MTPKLIYITLEVQTMPFQPSATPVGAIVLAIFLGWPIVSWLILPIIISAAAFLVSLIFGHIKPTPSKTRNATIIVIATTFLVLSFYLSLIFPASIAEGEHFRSIIPFLNVSFH